MANKTCMRKILFMQKYIAEVTQEELVLLAQKQPSRGALMKRCSENMQKIYRKRPCQKAISIKLLSNFIQITLRYGCSPVKLLHIFRKHFPKNAPGGLLR